MKSKICLYMFTFLLCNTQSAFSQEDSSYALPEHVLDLSKLKETDCYNEKNTDPCNITLDCNIKYLIRNYDLDVPVSFNCTTICSTVEEERVFRRELEKYYTQICSSLDGESKKKFHNEQMEWEKNLGDDYYNLGAYDRRLFYLKEDYKKRMDELKKMEKIQ